MDDTQRLKEFYVVGPEVEKFLSESPRTTDWALADATSSLREQFHQRFGDEPFTVSEFASTRASAVAVIDLSKDLSPGLAEFLS